MEPTNLATIDIHVHSAEQFLESFSEESNTIYYVMAGQSQPFDDDLVPPKPKASVKTGFRDLYDNFIFGNHIGSEDVSSMIKNNKWISGQKYDMYDDTDENLHTKRFYVVSEEPGGVYSIFKCLFNNKAFDDEGNEYVTPVSDQPMSYETFPGDLHYQTADGYVWKLMYTMTRAEYEKFATGLYVPISQNQAIKEAAKNGSIEKIVVTGRGSSYNSYAYGSVRQAAVNGNKRIISIQTDTNLDILTFVVIDKVGNFVEDHVPGTKKKIFFRKSTGQLWRKNGVTVAGNLYWQNATQIRALIPDGAAYDNDIVSFYQTSNNSESGPISAEATISSFRRDLIPNLSSNTDFYNESSFYIRSGKGAGQLRMVGEYVVTGNERRVILDQPFDIEPDATSRFEIGPRVTITGDGTTPATAIAVVEESSNSIIAIEIVESGANYSYADVTVTANTGYIAINGNEEFLKATDASVRAIIGPPGGHGYDVKSELGSRYVCMSTEINPNNEGVPTQNQYRNVSLLKDPLFARVQLTLAESSLIFIDGEIVYQDNGAEGEVFSRVGDVLTLKNVKGFFTSEQYVKTKRANNNLEVTVNNVDKNFEVVNQTLRLEIELTYAGVSATGFILGEEVYQDDTDARGYVNAVYEDRIDVVASKGTWNVSDTATSTYVAVIGKTSRATANVLSKVSPDLVDDSGKVLYVENFQPISRDEEQSEIVKIVLTF